MNKVFSTCHLKCAIFIFMVLSLVCTSSWKKTYEQNIDVLEQWYMDSHPDCNKIEWPQVANLTQKIHRKICDKVFEKIQPFFNEFIFEEEVKPDPEGPSTRVKAPVLLEMKKQMLAVPIVECIYNRNTTLMTAITEPQTILYLTQANSSRVFTLSKDPDVDIFALQTGVHPVSYSDK